MYKKAVKIMRIKMMPWIKPRAFMPMLAQISLRVHVKTEHEYHTHAYAIRVADDVTELLIADKENKIVWMNVSQIEGVES